MSIKGLTDRPAALPRLGVIRKGKPKPQNSNRPGGDSDQFELRDAPWVRVVEKTGTVQASAKGSRFDKGKTAVNGNGRTQGGERYENTTTGWRPGCACGREDVRPCVVLDPFCGSCTTVQVARRLGRVGIGLDLSRTYLVENALPRALGTNTQESMQFDLFSGLGLDSPSE